MSAGCNVILTGIPRSGTTLACHLINKLPNCIALHEPMPVQTLVTADHAAAMETVERFFAEARASLLADGTSPSKHVGGRIPDRHINAQPSSDGLRRDESSYGTVTFSKPLAPDFLLVLKHPSAFSALLPALHQRFPSFAMVRNPLAVLGSWNSVEMKFRDGHAPIAEQIDADLARALGNADDRLERQLVLLSWFFSQYRNTLPRERILRYEDVIASQGRALASIAPRAAGLSEPLISENASPLYDRGWIEAAAAALLARDGPYWDFYTRDELMRVLSRDNALA